MMAVDDDSLEATLCDHALELRDRRRRIAGRQGSEAEEPRRVAPNGFRDRVIRASRKCLRLLSGKLLDAGRGQRQRLHVDAGRIHRRDATVADVEKVRDERRKPAPHLLSPLLEPALGAVEEGGRGEVLFKGDDAHCGVSFTEGEAGSTPRLGIEICVNR